jgi:sn-glycerol 3-phosphate transport system ATP-binding protein
MNLLPLDHPDIAAWARTGLAGTLPQAPLDSLVLGVRPEKIALAETGLAAEVLSLEYLGADSLVACRAGGRELIVRQAGRVRLAAGERVHLEWPPDKSHFFAVTTGRRIRE